MTNYMSESGASLVTGAFFLGMGAGVGAQQAPEPQQYPQQPQGGAQQTQENDPGAARISFMQGDISTQHNGSTDWAAATINTPVVTGDHISTGQNARAEIQLDHANILRLSDQSTANVVNLSRTQMQQQVGQGLANYEVFKNNEANIEIDTPNVAIRPEMGEGSYRDFGELRWRNDCRRAQGLCGNFHPAGQHASRTRSTHHRSWHYGQCAIPSFRRARQRRLGQME